MTGAVTQPVLQEILGISAYWWPIFTGTAVNGSSRYWMIGTDGNFLYTISGTNGTGHVPIPKRRKITAKAGRSQWEQTILDVNSHIMKKERRDGFYVRDVNGEAQSMAQHTANSSSLADLQFDFMLAEDYVPGFNVNGYVIQPKIDGIRAGVYLSNGEVKFRTRGSKFIPFLQHLRQAFLPLLQKVPSNTIIDVELYIHGKTFSDISSIVRRTVNQHPDEQTLQAWIFDFIPPVEHKHLTYIQRHKILTDFQLQLPLYLLPYAPLASEAAIVDFHAEIKSQGYEGVILRNPHALYQQQRTYDILKYKVFFEEEVMIIGVFAGEGTEEHQALFRVQTHDGVQVTVRPRGTFELRQYWLQNPHLCLGRTDYTIIHFARDEQTRAPRFPVGKGFRQGT